MRYYFYRVSTSKNGTLLHKCSGFWYENKKRYEEFRIYSAKSFPIELLTESFPIELLTEMEKERLAVLRLTPKGESIFGVGKAGHRFTYILKENQS